MRHGELRRNIWKVYTLPLVVAVGTAPFCKMVLTALVSQAHISGLIKSKFTNYKDFHTLMYTCAAEFDFIELEVSFGPNSWFLSADHNSGSIALCLHSTALVCLHPLRRLYGTSKRCCFPSTCWWWPWWWER